MAVENSQLNIPLWLWLIIHNHWLNRLNVRSERSPRRPWSKPQIYWIRQQWFADNVSSGAVLCHLAHFWSSAHRVHGIPFPALWQKHTILTVSTNVVYARASGTLVHRQYRRGEVYTVHYTVHTYTLYAKKKNRRCVFGVACVYKWTSAVLLFFFSLSYRVYLKTAEINTSQWRSPISARWRFEFRYAPLDSWFGASHKKHTDVVEMLFALLDMLLLIFNLNIPI